MNWFIISSGAIAALTAGIHLSLGGVTIARPLLASSLEDEVKFTMYACWHLVSVILVLSAFALLATGVGMMALNSSPIAFISLSWLLFGLVFLTVTLGVAKPRRLFRFPQWILLIPVGILGIAGIV
jgi:uncharacterized Tic20 family protein